MQTAGKKNASKGKAGAVRGEQELKGGSCRKNNLGGAEWRGASGRLRRGVALKTVLRKTRPLRVIKEMSIDRGSCDKTWEAFPGYKKQEKNITYLVEGGGGEQL